MEEDPMGGIDHPSHYRSDTGFEAIDVIEAWGLGFNLGNVVKYIARAGHKGDAAEDLEKARWYLSREIESRGGDAESGPPEEPEAKPVPVDARVFSTRQGPLDLRAAGGRVRLSLGDARAFLAPEYARGLADAVSREDSWGDGIPVPMFVSSLAGGALWLRIVSEECGLTAAQAPIFASVLRELADEAEEKADDSRGSHHPRAFHGAEDAQPPVRQVLPDGQMVRRGAQARHNAPAGVHGLERGHRSPRMGRGQGAVRPRVLPEEEGAMTRQDDALGALTPEWQTTAQVAERAGGRPAEVRRALAALCRWGLAERRQNPGKTAEWRKARWTA